MTLHSNSRRVVLIGAAFALVSSAFALTPSEWSHRQSLTVEAPGLIEVELPEATFDQAQPGLVDLRLLDGDNREQPYLLFTPATKTRETSPSSSWDLRLQAESSVITITTQTRDPIKALHLKTPNPHFLCSALVESSEDKEHWIVVDRGLPLFRQYGVEKLELPLGGLRNAYLKVTIPSDRKTKLTVTGVDLEKGAAEEEPTIPVQTELLAREEFAGETVFTLRLAASHLPLAALTLRSPEALFMRRVSITVRDAKDGVPSETQVGEGTLYRVSVDGSPVRAELEIEFNHVLAGRELLVHVHNGDSPPLAVDEWIVKREPSRFLFLAPRAGSYVLLSGNPQVDSPRYDLAAFSSEIRLAKIKRIVPGALEPQPGHKPRELVASGLLPGAVLAGALFDAEGWKTCRAVQITKPGVQELELPPEVLSRTRSDFADLRLVRASRQLPYLLEKPALSRTLELSPVLEPDLKRSTLGRWRIELPHAGLPVSTLVLQSGMTLFDRDLRVYELRRGRDGQLYQRTLASGHWSRTPEASDRSPLSLTLQERMETDCLWVEMENGDNAALELSGAKAVYPVVRLLFSVTETDAHLLYLNNPTAHTPRYDLSLVSKTLYAAPRTPALVVSEEAVAESDSFRKLLHGGSVFWAALAVVVAALLFVMAKLLPKKNA